MACAVYCSLIPAAAITFSQRAVVCNQGGELLGRVAGQACAGGGEAVLHLGVF